MLLYRNINAQVQTKFYNIIDRKLDYTKVTIFRPRVTFQESCVAANLFLIRQNQQTSMAQKETKAKKNRRWKREFKPLNLASLANGPVRCGGQPVYLQHTRGEIRDGNFIVVVRRFLEILTHFSNSIFETISVFTFLVKSRVFQPIFANTKMAACRRLLKGCLRRISELKNIDRNCTFVLSLQRVDTFQFCRQIFKEFRFMNEII